jgi:TPR repeat protein
MIASVAPGLNATFLRSTATMELYSFRGGARIGWLNASWPFARLRVDTDRLTLVCLGTYGFSPSDVVAIEPVGSIPILRSGIRIRHNRANYPEAIIFWCLRSRDELLDAIRNSGFRAAGIPTARPRAEQRSGDYQMALRVALAVVIPLLVAIGRLTSTTRENREIDASLARLNTHITGSTGLSPFASRSTDPDIVAGDESIKHADYRNAREHFEQAVRNGDPIKRAQAETRLGYLLLHGLGGAPDPAAGVQHLKTAAGIGDPYAKANLSYAYATGHGVHRDDGEAVAWAAASAEQGVTWSMNAVGWAYLAGIGVRRDLTRSRLWYEKSADFGDSAGQAQLAWFYLQGLGVNVDLSRAMSLYQLSAQQGCALGEGQLGWMYVHVSHDYAQGKFWYERAAQQGDAAAENNLGYLYENGWGVPQDYAAAASWYTKSASQGFVRARFHLGTLMVTGQGLPRNAERGRALIHEAADAGDHEAMAWLQRSPPHPGAS